jgi:uncharacterized membrane protein
MSKNYCSPIFVIYVIFLIFVIIVILHQNHRLYKSPVSSAIILFYPQ